MPLFDPHIVVREWTRVPRSRLDLDEIRHRLTVVNPAFKPGFAAASDVEPYLHFWSEVPDDPGGFYLPRNFKTSAIPVTTNLDVYYPPPAYPYVDWASAAKFKPRDQVQKDALEALAAPARRYQSGKLLVLNAGKGKSVLAIRAAMTRPGPMMIAVDLHALVDQWRVRLSEAAGLTEDEIGFVQGPVSKWKWQGKKAVIAVMKTLVQRQWYDLDEEFRDYFATVIIDEVHVAGALQLGRVVGMFPGERWGLTATPGRHDGQDVTLHLHVARKACFTHVEQDLIPTIYLHHTGIQDPSTYIFGPGKGRDRWHNLASLNAMDDDDRARLAKSVKSWISSPREIAHAAGKARKLSLPATISYIAERRDRTKAISRFIKTLADDGRTILVIGSRTGQLQLLHKWHAGSGLVLGNVKKAARTSQIYDYPVVYAEQSLVSKGLDRPEFDTLVVLQLDAKIVTKVEVPQSIGRIQRPLPDKLPTEAHYFIDENSSMIGRSEAALMVQLRLLFRGKLQIEKVQWKIEKKSKRAA